MASQQPPNLTLYDTHAPNPLVVRLFILERGGCLTFEIIHVDLTTLGNRKKAYTTNVNPRGEVPALRINDTFVLTETTAICEYLDEVATSGASLFGNTPLERAETRMWLRRMDNEIAQPVIQWWRNDPDNDFYRGYRTPIPDARVLQKVAINQALNMLDEELEGKKWLCGERFSAADVHFYGVVSKMAERVAQWVLNPARKNVVACSERMHERDASKMAKLPSWADGLQDSW